MSELYKSFSDFEEHVNEASFIPTRSIVLRRKYKNSNEEKIGLRAPVRTKVLEFINSKGSVTHSELDEMIQTVKEDAGAKPSWAWVRKNASLVDKKVSESGEISYSLTKRGKRVLETLKEFEDFSNFYKEKYYPENLKTTRKGRQLNKFLKFERTNESEEIDEDDELDENKLLYKYEQTKPGQKPGKNHLKDQGYKIDTVITDKKDLKIGNVYAIIGASPMQGMNAWSGGYELEKIGSKGYHFGPHDEYSDADEDVSSMIVTAGDMQKLVDNGQIATVDWL